jgi:hypothetical protein
MGLGPGRGSALLEHVLLHATAWSMAHGGHGARTQSCDNLPRRAKAATAQLGTFISNCQTFIFADAGAIPPHPHVSKVSEVAYGLAIVVAVGLCARMGVCEHRLRAHLIIPQPYAVNSKVAMIIGHLKR